MKNIFFIGIGLLLLIACNSPSDANKKQTYTKVEALSDKNPIKTPEQVKKTSLPFVEDNFSTLSFPITIDTVIFDESKKLSNKFALQLEKMVKDEGQRYMFQFPSFIKLVSLENGQDPVESGSFDIGESISVTYYNMGYTFLKEQNKWIAFVGVEYEGYPACPWGSGREIVLCSFDENANFIDATTIAENSEGGDPPVWGKTIKKVNSENGEIYNIDVTYINGEEDDNGNTHKDIDNRKVKISILSDGKIEQKERKANN
ncbi:hypothetical protein [Bernardetia sp.]|uniref:hypothetical protein n=1 Tax=Bernardetia sp. TaxID=1937974 RepID=UPI0025C14B39|nr:hypothetical protein [Bernardetia sp.]